MGKTNQSALSCVKMSVSPNTIGRPRFIAASIVAALGVATLLGGCGTTPNSTGTLIGTFKIVTGGVTYGTVPGTGHVIIRHGGRRITDHQVFSGGTFKVTLAPGSYQISSTCAQSRHETQLSIPKWISIGAKLKTRADIQCLLNPTTG